MDHRQVSNSNDVPNNQAIPSSFLDYALAYAARGWRVFPLSERSKKPVARSNGFCDATTDAERIRRYWTARPLHNVGIATGRVSGLLVVDLDPKHDGVSNFQQIVKERGGLTQGPTVRTGSGGLHLYFKLPDGAPPIGCSAGQIAPGVDVRCDGGYVVAAGSVHPDGPLYQWEPGYSPDEVELALPPPWLLKACREASATCTSGDGKKPKTPDEWRDLFAMEVSEGKRETIGLRIYGYLITKHSALLAKDILKLWNNERCKPPLKDCEIQRMVDSVARRELRKLEGK